MVPIVEMHDFSFRYDNNAEWALRDLNIEVHKGEVLALLGASGAGKTTLCLSLAGVIPHYYGGEYSGSIFVKGNDVKSRELPELANTVGLVLQDPEAQLFNITVIEELRFGLENQGLYEAEIQERVDEALVAVGLSGRETSRVEALSGGQKQRLAIACVLAMRPEILILDEPTSELDSQGSEDVFQVVRDFSSRRGTTTILATHDTDHVIAFCDRAIVLRAGEIAAEGQPSTLLQNIELMRGLGVRVPSITSAAYTYLDSHGTLEGRNGVLPVTLRDGIEVFTKWVASEKQRTQADLGFEADTCMDEDAVSALRLVHTYPSGTSAVNGVDLRISMGEMLFIVGVNGSGKSTLVKHFNGMLRPTSGLVNIAGTDTRQRSVAELARQVGYIFQNPDHQIHERTVNREVRVGPRNLGMSKDMIDHWASEALKSTMLESLGEVHPYSLTRNERQRLAIASVIAMHPKILIADEPTTALDARQSEVILSLLEALHRDGSTVIVITHDLDAVEALGHRMIVMAHGQVLADNNARRVLLETNLLVNVGLKQPGLSALAASVAERLGEEPIAVETIIHSWGQKASLLESR